MLISTFKEVLAAYSKAKLLIVGDGPLKAELTNYVQHLGIKEKILFLGERDDIPQLLSIFDIFALSSLSEGISLVLLEAMAAGLPIVATDVGGNGELIEEGENGFLVPSQDIGAMSNGLKKILDNDGLRQKISEANRKKAILEFGIERMCREYEALYESQLRISGYPVIRGSGTGKAIEEEQVSYQ